MRRHGCLCHCPSAGLQYQAILALQGVVERGGGSARLFQPRYVLAGDVRRSHDADGAGARQSLTSLSHCGRHADLRIRNGVHFEEDVSGEGNCLFNARLSADRSLSWLSAVLNLVRSSRIRLSVEKLHETARLIRRLKRCVTGREAESVRLPRLEDLSSIL